MIIDKIPAAITLLGLGGAIVASIYLGICNNSMSSIVCVVPIALSVCGIIEVIRVSRIFNRNEYKGD